MSKKISELTSATTPLAGTELVEIVQSGTSKKVAASYLTASGGGREVLVTTRTYYVRSDGSDSNDGLANTSGGSFLTIQKAVDVVCALDMSIYGVTIQCGDATRTEQVVLKSYLGSVAPSIIGNTTTPANCLMSATSGNCFTNESGNSWVVSGFKMTTATSGFCIYAFGGGSKVSFSLCDFGASASNHISARTGAHCIATGNYTISGSASAHGESNESGLFQSNGVTVTISGTPAFSTGYLYGRQGQFLVHAMSFSGSATGPRFSLNLCSTVFSNGGAEASYLPGNSAGSKNTGSEWA